MKMNIIVSRIHEEQKHDDYVSDPLIALDIVERLRLESGKFLYEYPARFRRIIEVIRRK